MYRTYILSDGYAIKIGKTKRLYNLNSRIRRLQCGNPRKIVLLGGLSNDLETELHRCYKDFRLKGEWFRKEILFDIFKKFDFIFKADFEFILCADP